MNLFDQKGIRPMLIDERVEPYDDPNSIFELKLDGLRCIGYFDKENTDLRNKRDIKLLPRFPELRELHKACNEKCILDGELVVLINGKPNFRELQRRAILNDPFKIELAMQEYPACFVAYDIVYYDGKDITKDPLMERKQILESVISETNSLAISRYIDTSGIALFELAKQHQLEGIVGKKKNSLYWFGKLTHDWKKVKWMKDEDFICIGYILKPNNMTSFILAKYGVDNKLVISNHVTLGASLNKLRQFGYKEVECPFTETPKNCTSVVWIAPIVCTVEYMPSEQIDFRQATFKCFRDDKIPEECRIEV